MWAPQARRDKEQLIKGHELRKQPDVLVKLLVQVKLYQQLLVAALRAEQGAS